MPKAQAASLFDVSLSLVNRYLRLVQKVVPLDLESAPDDLRGLTRTPGPSSKKI
jgi:hypothetical protein